MRLLLDTHTAIWAVGASRRLPDEIAGLIADPDNDIFISAVSLWEIAIKHALGRSGPDAIPVSASEALSAFEAAGYSMLPVAPRHVLGLETLPALHGDPFDRLLVAQALSEPLTLVTHDGRLAAYSNTIVRF